MIHLPREILTDILLRLPFHLIVKCKLVSKQWNDFIKSLDFAKAYDSNSRSSSTTLFIRNGILHCRLNNRVFKLQRRPLSNNEPDYNQLLSPPSNAIACVTPAGGSFHLCSLFTGRTYPPVLNPLSTVDSESWLLYGFGFDRRADDYKIITVAMNRLFLVYSCRNSCWKASKGFPYSAYDWSSTRGNRTAGAYSFNGVLHWVFRAVGDRKEVIVTYDLHTNRFGEIAVPKEGKRRDISFVEKAELEAVLESSFGSSKIETTTLGEWKGKLCLVHKVDWRRRVIPVWVLQESPVWVMKEYHVMLPHLSIPSMKTAGWPPLWGWLR